MITILEGGFQKINISNSYFIRVYAKLFSFLDDDTMYCFVILQSYKIFNSHGKIHCVCSSRGTGSSSRYKGSISSGTGFSSRGKDSSSRGTGWVPAPGARVSAPGAQVQAPGTGVPATCARVSDQGHGVHPIWQPLAAPLSSSPAVDGMVILT